MKRIVSMLVAVGCLVACLPAMAGAQQAPGYFVDPATLPFEPLPGAQAYWGLDENPGAAADGWRIEVPANWNGGLLLWAHGYRGVDPELTVDEPALRPYLIAKGWAWAASSYRANGYAVEEGVEDTNELLAIFTEQTGLTPERTIFHGGSMGGHITGAAIERYPGNYDAALPICGVLGDVALFDYFQDVNLVAQALAGVEASIPPGPDYLTATLPAITAEIGYPGELNGRGYQFAAAVEQLSGGERPGFEAALEYWSGPETSNVGAPFLFEVYSGVLTGGQVDPRDDAATGNAGRVYQYDTDPALAPEEAELNAAVQREAVTAPPPFPVITGDLPVPVLSLHTLGDLFVPFSMEQIYAAEAAANGDAGLLVQRAIRDGRHCGFAPDELIAAFDDLVAWLDTGARPAGDDLGNPETTADRDFGCAFTSPIPVPERDGYPLCGAPPGFDLTAGADPVGTSVAVSRETQDAAGAVVLAQGYEDALAAAPLAAREDAPLLLVAGDGLAPEVATEITRLGATTAYLVGDVAVEADLVALGLTGVRLAGPVAVADELGGSDAFVVAGEQGAAVAGLAAFLEEPVLFVEPSAVPAETAQAVAGLGLTSLTVVGDVSEEVVAQLAGLGTQVERLRVAQLPERSVASGVAPSRPWVPLDGGWPSTVAGGRAAAETGDLLVPVDARSPARSAGLRYLLREREVLETVRLVASGSGSAAEGTVRGLLDQ